MRKCWRRVWSRSTACTSVRSPSSALMKPKPRPASAASAPPRIMPKAIFAEPDNATKPSVILATNTSYLDIDEIATATQRPAQVLGLHFFSPAHIMKLLEVVRGKATAQDVLEACLAVGKKIG